MASRENPKPIASQICRSSELHMVLLQALVPRLNSIATVAVPCVSLRNAKAAFVAQTLGTACQVNCRSGRKSHSQTMDCASSHTSAPMVSLPGLQGEKRRQRSHNHLQQDVLRVRPAASVAMRVPARVRPCPWVGSHRVLDGGHEPIATIPSRT